MILKFEDYIFENKDSDELKEFISKNSPDKSIVEDIFVEISDEFNTSISTDIKFDKNSYEKGEFAIILKISIIPPQRDMMVKSAASVEDLQKLNAEFKTLESLSKKILQCISRVKNLMDFDDPQNMNIFGIRTWEITFSKLLVSEDLKKILSSRSTSLIKTYPGTGFDELVSNAIDDIQDIMNDSGIPLENLDSGINITDFRGDYVIGIYLYNCLAAEINKDEYAYEIFEIDIVNKCREILRGEVFNY